MLKKLKSEIKTVKWPNRKTVLDDIKVVVIASIVMMIAMAGIDLLGLIM